MAEKIGMSKNGIIYSIDKLRKMNIISKKGHRRMANGLSENKESESEDTEDDK